MIAVTASLRAKPGSEADLERLLRDLAEKVTASEKGCREYRAARAQHDPRLYLLFERYDDEEALADHANAEHYREAIGELMDCLEGRPRLVLYETLE